jgi:Domain of unknown function (DUF4430)
MAGMIEITLTVDFGCAGKERFEKPVTIAEKSTVLDALSMSITLATSPRFGMDHFVEEIDGIRNDLTKALAWHFEVNGFPSNVPAERYLLKNGDWIQWRYIEELCEGC